MPKPLVAHLPLERAHVRRVLFAVELIDAATLEPVKAGIDVTATGLSQKPIVNCEGLFVFLEEGETRPQQIIVSATKAPYESVMVAAPNPPARSIRIELAPRIDYQFTAGITVMRGTLIEDATGPRAAIPGAEIWLQWIDDNTGINSWVDSPTHSHSNASGDFTATLRLSENQAPRPHIHSGLNVRLRVRRGNAIRTSMEFSLPQGHATNSLLPFAWSELER